MAIALGKAPEQGRRRASGARRDRPGPCGPSRRSAGAARCPSARRASRRSRRSGPCRRRRPSTSCTVARCEIVILVCEMARSPAMSTELPPRKCRMLTPLSKPARLTSMNSSAEPWNQVAIMRPSACHTLRKRSQSPASRHTTQFSTMSRIASRSSISESIGRALPSVGRHDSTPSTASAMLPGEPKNESAPASSPGRTRFSKARRINARWRSPARRPWRGPVPTGGCRSAQSACRRRHAGRRG